MKIGPYELEAEVGRGGAGVVWRARGPEGLVAVKLLKKLDPDKRARFEREVRLQELLAVDGGFVPVLSSSLESEAPYLVLPYLAGGTLRDRLGRGVLRVEETVALGRSLADALARAHALGVVHRDLKPENVLFADASLARPLIADLGLAKHFRRDLPGGSASIQLSRRGVARGTFGYMPLEQIEDALTVGPAVDVFALGAVLYECLSGKPPFEGESLVQVIAGVDAGTVEPLLDIAPSTPAWLASVIERALSKERWARFADGAAFARALVAPTEQRAGLGRSKLAVRAAFVVGLLAAGGLLFFAGRWSKDERAPRGLPSTAASIAPTPVAVSSPPTPSATITASTPASPSASPSRPAKPDGARVQALLGTAGECLLREDWNGAIAAATTVIELDPRQAQAWATRSEALRRGNAAHGAAITDATEAIKLDPKLARAWQARGLARASINDLPGARVDLSEAIALDPKLVAAWTWRGYVRLRSRNVEGAIQDLTEAIALDPRSVVALQLRGEAHLAQGSAADMEAAIADLTEAIKLDRRLAGVWANRANAWSRRKRFDDCISDATEAIELDPRLTTAWTTRGWAHINRSEWDAAIADCSKAIELNPGEANAWSNRGWARVQKQEWQAAEADCSEAIKLDVSMHQVWANRGAAREQLGNVSGAIEDFEKFLEIGNDDPWAPRIRGELAQLRAKVAK